MKDKFHIALLSIHSCPFARLGGKDTGGMNVYIRELTSELIQREHSVDIFTAAHRCGHCSSLKLGKGVGLIHLKNNDSCPITHGNYQNYFNSLAAEIEDYRKANSLRYDLIHSHYWQSGIVGVELQSHWHVPHVTMFHTLGAIKDAMNISSHDPIFRTEKERHVMENCDLIIASTEKEKTYLSEFYHAYEEKISVIPCGVNLNLFQPLENGLSMRNSSISGREKIILFVGRLEPLKGIDHLLKAFSIIKDKLPSRLIIIGGDEDSKAYLRVLQQQADSLSISDKVKFVGSVLQSELPQFYNAADVSVVSSYYESFCLVILESLACGTPVLTTNVGAAEKIIKAPFMGAVVDSNEPQNMAHKLLQVLTSNNKTMETVGLNRLAVQPYAWSIIADEILDKYSSITGNKCLCMSVS